MKISLIIRIVFISLSLLFIFNPFVLHAIELDSSMQGIEPSKTLQDPNQMSQKEMNDLLGEDPYLGQTSYLQSPEAFSQRRISK